MSTDPPVVAIGMTITDGLAQQINASAAELKAWRMAHFAGAKFLAAIERDPTARPLVIAVESYRQAIEQVLAESGFPAEHAEPRTAAGHPAHTPGDSQ
jgi:hypothetical protein